MKKLSLFGVVPLLSCVMHGGCDYAKPTDVEKVDRKVEALRAQLNQQREELEQQQNQQKEDLEQQLNQQEEELQQQISQQEEELQQQLNQQEEELQQQISQQEEELQQQLNQQEEELQQQEEELQQQLDSWEIVFALIGANLMDMGQIRSESSTHGVLPTNEVHVYEYIQDENREVTIGLDGSGDIVLSLLREMDDGSFDNLGRFDQDFDSTYRTGWDASIFNGTLEAATYLLIVEAYSFEEELQYRISFVFP